MPQAIGGAFQIRADLRQPLNHQQPLTLSEYTVSTRSNRQLKGRSSPAHHHQWLLFPLLARFRTVAPTTGLPTPPIGSFQAISTDLILDPDGNMPSGLSRFQPALDDDILCPKLGSAAKPDQFASRDSSTTSLRSCKSCKHQPMMEESAAQKEACRTAGRRSSLESKYYDLGDLHRPVSTSSPLAQTWFNRGLVWCYGFNHEEAAKCFERAIAHDPGCAMAYWGLAYSLGPNYNKPWDLFGRREIRNAASRTHHAIEKAKACADSASPVERALVDALRYRYPRADAPTKTDRPIWNREYADAMASVAAQYPDDLDVATLYADSMMNLTPWALWDIRTGNPASEARTLEVKRVLDHGMSLEGGNRHPGLLHLYIHLMEMSNTPEAAMPAANNLRGLVPDSGHLNHMPSHLDILLGDYSRAVVANTDAVRADEKFLRREGPMNFYTLYRSHDYHFRLYSAMFSGQSKVALETVEQLEASFSEELLRVETPPMADWLEAFLAMRVHVLIRFGKWKDILALKMPEDQDLYCVTTALTHYAKGMAYAALGQVDEAREQRQLFADSVPRVKPSRTLFNNKCIDILCVAESMLDGEIEYRSANYHAAFAHLRESIVRYDGLPFDEPWGWMQPARHAYGALLLEQGHVSKALSVYSADLGIDDSLPRVHRHPNNVWALHGYHECLVKLGRIAEAKEVEGPLRKAMAVADVPVTSSCFCRLRTAKI